MVVLLWISQTFSGAVFVIRAIRCTKMSDIELSMEEGDLLRLLYKSPAWREFMGFLQEEHVGVREEEMGVLCPVAACLAERCGQESAIRLRIELLKNSL